VLSMSPSIRGGVVSIFSLILAAMGMIIALMKAIFSAF
jgi:hypothetical protein